MSTHRIQQGVIQVTFQNGGKPFFRVSRTYLSTLAKYWRNQNGFKYLKIYDIVDYSKGKRHVLGGQTGYITKNGMKYDSNGINETYNSVNFKSRHGL
jgi:hypothetical protein